MNKTILSLMFACTCAGYAWAGADFATGTNFEGRVRGLFDYRLDDAGTLRGATYWQTDADTNGLMVVAHEREGSSLTNELSLSVYEPLERCIFPLADGAVSNVALGAGIYVDTHIALTVCESAPMLVDADKLALWLRAREDDAGQVTTNLMITAGFFDGDYNRIAVKDYALTNIVAEGAWCRVTVRTIENITENVLRHVPGFVVFIDGAPAAMLPDDAIGANYRSDWLTAEARLLVNERRLFPWLVRGDADEARTLSRAAFAGIGAVEDVYFSSQPPQGAAPDNVFTLQWDRGITAMTCIVSNASDVVTNTFTDLTAAGCRDYALGTNNLARVTVTNIVYDATHGYTNNEWKAENDCTTQHVAVASGVFIYKGAKANPIGYVTTSRDVISVGEGGYATFKEAKAKAKGQKLALNSDLVISSVKIGDYNDKGVLTIEQGDDIVLDLCGHTLQGRGKDNNQTINQTGGTLTIIDTVGGGAVLPPTNKTMAVKSYAKNASTPKLIIEAGRFAGEVCITGYVSTAVPPAVYKAECQIGGGSFTNLYNDAQFYLEQYVTNATAYYSLDAENYWSMVDEEDAFIWCGAGANTKWTTPANWKGKVVPGSDDLAIFPRRGDALAWSVDFGLGVSTKRLWLDADVALSGTNEFSDVTVERGAGCFVGSGTMSFTGALPGILTGATGAKGVRLGSAWRGTVKISNIVKPAKLTNIDGWGVAGSKVEFAGVRGYIMDKSNHTLPYELILTDDGTTPAWKNDTGYTGSTVSFPRLSGEGTFTVPSNSRTVLQMFQFVDVADFLGSFGIVGRRLMLGSGIATNALAGTIAFSDGVTVRSGLNWTGVGAQFGKTITVHGQVNDTLMSYTGTTVPSVGGVKVMLYDSEGGFTTNTLYAADGKIVIDASWEASMALVGGAAVSAGELGTTLVSGSSFEIPAGSAISVSGNHILVNGKIFSTIADYYTLTQKDTSLPVFTVAFDKAKATPSLANLSVSSEDGIATLTVTNAKKGLWYGLKSTSSLAESLDKADVEWRQATGDTVTFESETSGSSSFYQVIMTDQNPLGGAQ